MSLKRIVPFTFSVIKTSFEDGKTIAVHPLAKSAIQKGKATDNKSEADGNIYTVQDENSIWTMMSQVLEALLLALKNKGKKKRSEDFFRSFTSCPIRVYEKDSKVITS